jgi:hypothetical protein
MRADQLIVLSRLAAPVAIRRHVHVDSNPLAEVGAPISGNGRVRQSDTAAGKQKRKRQQDEPQDFLHAWQCERTNAAELCWFLTGHGSELHVSR